MLVVPSNFDDDDPQWYDHKFIDFRQLVEHASDSS
jgi:hypothetical protein